MTLHCARSSSFRLFSSQNALCTIRTVPQLLEIHSYTQLLLPGGQYNRRTVLFSSGTSDIFLSGLSSFVLHGHHRAAPSWKMLLSRLTGKKGNHNHNKTSIGENLVVFKTKDFRDDYTVVKRVGVGSISNIYIVRPKNTEKSTSKEKVIWHALKAIDKAFLDEHYMDEMKNEIALMRNITHPNILKIYEVYEQKNISIVMELCTGGDLNQRVPYSEMQAKSIVTKLVEAANYLHLNNIIHRDLKFENIMYESTKEDAEIKVSLSSVTLAWSSHKRILCRK
jgi:serine/threonine protein kinase